MKIKIFNKGAAIIDEVIEREMYGKKIIDIQISIYKNSFNIECAIAVVKYENN